MQLSGEKILWSDFSILWILTNKFCATHLCAGAVGIIWFVLWSFLAYSTPATHPRISKEEREYIVSSIAESAAKV